MQNTSVILLVSKKIPRLLARDTSHVTRACTDTALPPSTSRHCARPPPDCQSKNGERSSTTGQEKEKQRPERHLIYAFCYLLSVAKQLHTSHSSGKMQGCKVSTGKWMLSVESQVNTERSSKNRLPACSGFSITYGHLADSPGLYNNLFSTGSSMSCMPFQSKPPHDSPSDCSSWELLMYTN